MSLREEIRKGKIKIGRGKGRAELIKFANNKKLTRQQAIWAHCCMCCGYWIDEVFDCRDEDCPLYPYSPYYNTGKGN